MAEENKAASQTAKAEAANAAAEAASAADSPGVVKTHAEGTEAGYIGISMSKFPHEVHETGSEELRARIFGAAPVATQKALDGPFASVEAARGTVVMSTDLATKPTLDGAVRNAPDKEAPGGSRA